MSKINKLYRKYREYIVYIIFGGLTTIVNFLVFWVSIKFTNNIIIANTIAFIIAVLFAYFTNNKYVFESNKENSSKDVLLKIVKFFSTRITTFFIETMLLYGLVNINMDEMISKLLVAIIVVILNYILSKRIVFNN
ncbi:GtrA family protein [Clostridium sp. CMCC3677]|uniref:GtrA family protein n=1 Tax=Clostridium sp. CMCC3677 TaxID=2949963 RepID=UPI0013F1303E|nr:GtrA family protein [Clostridium sp. CMCC3677]NFG60733.1 GtrA family protein [Clostridium botulinum]NFQ08167.1 GtrA family protein [Clostridium botulinum]